MERVRFKLLFLLLVLLLIYTIFPAPFITNKQDYWTYTPFSIACTIGNSLIFITSITNNVLLVIILLKKHRTTIFGSINFLIVLMCVADITYTTFYLPFVVVYTWIRQFGTNINYDILISLVKFCTLVHYGAAGISVAAFTVACVQRLYIITSRAVDYVSGKIKCLLVVLCFAYGSVLFSTNDVWTDASDRSHLLNSIMVVFFPITLNFVVLAAMVFYKEVNGRFNNDRNLNFVGLYVVYCLFFVCWVPFFIIATVHMYNDDLFSHIHYGRLIYILPTLFTVKSPLNLPLLLCTDERLYKKCVELLQKWFCRGKQRSRRGEENNNGDMYSELQEFHLSASRIDMYTEQQHTTDDQTKELVQYYV